VLVGAAAAGLPSPVVASSGGGRQITDAENTRTVYLVVTVLVLLAIGLALFTWWFWRSTRREHEALAPLEVMGDRKFRAADTLTRQVMLDGNRPVGAAPLAHGATDPLMVAPVAELESGPVAAGELEAGPVVAGELEAGVVAAAEVEAGPVAAGELEAGAVADAPPAADAPSVPAEDDADATATTVIAGSPGATDDAAAVDAAAAADLAAVAADEEAGDPGDQSIAVEVESLADDADAPATDADATALMPVAAATSAAPADVPTSDPAPSDAAPTVAAEPRRAPTPIDPGLPLPPADDEPPRHLSLADLAALHADAPIGFDDGELASTPSTGIPVIESPEAWLQRQLAGTAGGAPVNGHGEPGTPDDPDEPRPATVRGAE
jgi:hypothetical protein